MPQAGWCRECGDWVWVDEQGACQNGHGPESVAGIHEAEPQPDPFQPRPETPAVPDEPGFGVGEMPDEVYRFNWGAFFLPPVWGVVYGAWPVVSLWVLTLMISLLAGSLLGAFGGEDSSMGLATATVLAEIASGAMRLYIGVNASTWSWKREALRMKVLEGAPPRFSVKHFLARQRTWALAGLGIQVFSAFTLMFIATAPEALYAQIAEQLATTRVDLGLAVLWVVAEVALGVWLASQMRKERPGTARPADSQAG
jgi:hypothetical protein